MCGVAESMLEVAESRSTETTTFHNHKTKSYHIKTRIYTTITSAQSEEHT